MSQVFFIVGPTASGKSDLAADLAVRVGAEIVNADAFQIYAGFDVLGGKPDLQTLEKVRHHLIGCVPASEQMSAARYRALALPVLDKIRARGRMPVVVGGSGLYVKALTHGLVETPPADSRLREELDGLSLEQLRVRLGQVDPVALARVDTNNRRRLVRAIEICLLTGQPGSTRRAQWNSVPTAKTSRSGDLQIAETTNGRRLENRRSLAGGNPLQCEVRDYRGIFVFRDRDDLYQRINQRVEEMLKQGAVQEVRDAQELSRTAEQMIGVRDIRNYLAGNISLAETSSQIQQSTRRYAKRQLTWFRRQTNLEPLNLSLLSHNEAVEWVTRRAIVGRMVND